MKNNENKKTILVICRRENDLKLLSKIKVSKKLKIILASDSILVQEKAKKNPIVAEVTFIEQMESLFSVAEDVLKIREKINSWLVKLDANLPPYLLEWIKWAEGGNTTQKIQDAILLINSYQYLISHYKADEVILFRRIDSYWEDEILLETAKSKNLQVKKYNNLFYPLASFLKLNIIKIKISNKKYLVFYLPEFLIIKLKQARLILRIFRSKICRKDNIKSKNKLITFLLGSSAEKHVDNTAIVMKEFSKRGGYMPVALCWDALEGNKKIRKYELKADNLEAWFPLIKSFDLFVNYIKTIILFKKNLKIFKKENNIEYRKIFIGQLLISFITNFVEANYLSRLFLYYSSINYLKYKHPIAIRTWGENVMEYGLIFSNVLKEKTNRNNIKRPIIFDNFIGITVESPYYDSKNKPDIIFVSGELDKDICKNYLGNNSTVVISGFGQNTKIVKFKQKNNLESSKEILGISNLCDYNVFYVSNGILRGIINKQEHIKLATVLIEFTMLHKNVSLIIKPHPSEDEYFWHRFLEIYNFPDNVLLFDKKTNPYHCINICDVVITKFSTLALEAMEFKKPVISVVIDGESKFQNIFDNGIEKIADIKSLLLLLEKITSNKEVFNAWGKKRIVAQNELLPRRMFKSEILVEKIIVDNVINYNG